MIKALLFTILATNLLSGCTTAKWDVYETSKTIKDKVYKRTILLDKETGNAWVLRTSGNDYWLKIPKLDEKPKSEK